MKTAMRIMLGVTAFVCVAVVAQAAVNAPFVDGFEDGTLGANWSKSGAGDAVVQAASKYQGAYGVSVHENALSLAVDGSQSKAWILVYAKPAWHNDSNGEPSVSSSDAAAFYVNSSGELKVRDAGSWVVVETGIPAGRWLAFAVHMDYDNDRWSLFLSTTGTFADKLTNVGGWFHFNSSYAGPGTALNTVIVDTDTEAQVDDIAISASPSDLHGGADTKLALLQTKAGIKKNMQIPGFDYAYGSENQLNQLLGSDLKGGLVDGDKLHVQTHAGWKQFDVLSGAWSDTDNYGFANAPVARMTGLVLNRGAGSDYIAFFPYTTETAIPAPGQAGNPLITGKDDVDTGGYNCLTWPSETSRSAGGTGSDPFGFARADGDRIYIYTPTYRMLNYNASVGYWREGSKPSSLTLTRGMSFWYFRNQNSTANWTPPNP